MKQFVYYATAALLLFACTPEENNTSGTDEPGGRNDNTAHVTGISIDRSTATIKEGESIMLVATVTPDNADNKTVKWSSSSEAVASVNADGKVIGIKAGSATITATAEDGGMKASCALSVEAKVEQFVISAVDLGLPSGVKWADANIGASFPEDYGDYYAWGETETKEDYSWPTYKWCNGSNSSFTKYNTNSYFETVDNKTVLDQDDDVAHVKLGGNWRMPTDAEWTELRTECTWTWTTQNGVYGRLVTSKTNGNSIFLPAAGIWIGTSLFRFNVAESEGFYWSSSLDTGYPYSAYLVGFYSGVVLRSNDNRCYGLSVRPVSE